MSHQIKIAVEELQALVKAINFKKDLLKDIKEGNPKIQKLLELIKEHQEEIKMLLAADLDHFTIEQELKELNKELKQGAKNAVKGTGFKAKQLIDFSQAKVKEDAVEKTVEKGQIFSALNNQSK